MLRKCSVFSMIQQNFILQLKYIFYTICRWKISYPSKTDFVPAYLSRQIARYFRRVYRGSLSHLNFLNCLKELLSIRCYTFLANIKTSLTDWGGGETGGEHEQLLNFMFIWVYRIFQDQTGDLLQKIVIDCGYSQKYL